MTAESQPLLLLLCKSQNLYGPFILVSLAYTATSRQH